MKPGEGAQKELVLQWFHKAKRGFSLARYLLAEAAQYPEAVAFHSQQAVENLKAFLILHQVDFPKTHNLGELLDRVGSHDATLAASLRDVTALNPYGVEYRYPGDFPDLVQKDAEIAFYLAEKAWAAIAGAIEIAGE